MISMSTMREALRLTRGGNLRAATALLRGRAPASAEPIIEGEFRVVDEVPDAARTTQTPLGAGRFVAGTFVHAQGTREYKLWIPAAQSAAPSSRSLIVMLHGCTQNADDFAAGTRMNALADQGGNCVLYPVQSATANSHRCWRWFEPGDQQRDVGEPALLAAMTRHIVHEQAIDPKRVYVAGLSAGAAMAVILAHTHADVFAAFGAHSGLAYGAADSVPSALAVMAGNRILTHRAGSVSAVTPIPGILLHGDRDTTVVPANSQALVDQLIAGYRERRQVTLTASTQVTAAARCTRYSDAGGKVEIEFWTLHGAGHAWSGGDAAGSYTYPAGPDASRLMLAFFAAHPRV
jgi:poly(hydroxyalkanoate) depolymerase family esterase